MRRRLPPVFLCLALALVLGFVATVRADPTSDASTRLKQALKKGDTQERVDALRSVGRLASAIPPAKRRTAAVSIRKAIDGEQDDEVRAAMVRTLARLGGVNGWNPVLAAWRQDRDPVIKAAARQALLWGGGDYLEVVEQLWKQDKDPTYRAELMLLLRDRRRPDAVPLLLQALAGNDVRVQSAAAESLEAITKQAYGFDLNAWTAWWEKEGPRLLLPPKTEPPDPNADTVTVTEKPVHLYEEPPPHVTRSLIPDFYGLQLTSKDIVFVLDISGSVGAGGVGRAKRELVHAIESLGTDVWVSALFFDETVHMWKPEMVQATPANKADLAFFMRGIQTGRKTDVFTPLNAGLQIVRRRLAQRIAAGEPIREAITLIVVSDGKETSRQTPPSVVVDKLDRLDPEHTVVHTVVLGGQGSRLLMELARRGGGHYVHAP